MEHPALNDKDLFPSEKVIFSILGTARSLWQAFFEAVHSEHPDCAEEWRYYNDGKCWLLKVTRKKKTVFWLSVIPKAFRVTFYFGAKAEEQILESAIADRLKDQFVNGKQYNKIRGITIVFKRKEDIAQALLLMELKISLH